MTPRATGTFGCAGDVGPCETAGPGRRVTGLRVELPIAARLPIVAVGGELKNTVCVVGGNQATVTDVLGNLSDVNSYRRFVQTIDDIQGSLAGGGLCLAHDLHPAYLSTDAALTRAGPGCSRPGTGRRGNEPRPNRLYAVQHHHAHIASCMAEHAITTPVIGIACDGTGYGSDGAIWGCEVLYATPSAYQRRAHLDYFALPGGDAAATQTWRPALSLIRQSFGDDVPFVVRDRFSSVPGPLLRTVEAMLRRAFNCPKSSSLGRLFDAAAFLTGLGEHNDVEGQAARRLEEAAGGHADVPSYPYRLVEREGCTRMVVSDMIRALGRDLMDGVTPGVMAGRFHTAVAGMLSEAALRAAQDCRVEAVVLGGGCFLNRILTERITALLHEGGLGRVWRPERLSCGDAGLSLGQAYCAAANMGSTG